MKKILLLGCAVTVLVIAGCLTNPPATGTTRSPLSGITPTLMVPSVTTESTPVLPMNTTVVLGTRESPFSASVDSFETDTPTQPGKQTVTIYIAVKNTGTEPVQMIWFSKLTDINGNMYGGIGISHGGTGARSGLIMPDMTEAARDYIVVPEAGFAQLSKGAVLDVYFMIKKSDAETISLKPDYHTRWAIDPGVIA